MGQASKPVYHVDHGQYLLAKITYNFQDNRTGFYHTQMVGPNLKCRLMQKNK